MSQTDIVSPRRVVQICDLSIPLKFDAPQPNVFGVESATATACRYGTLVGDTRQGGSCNFESVTLIPHCNGTHTECVGHITKERISVRDCLTDVIIPSRLVSVMPVSPNETNESYVVEINESDSLITRRSLETLIEPYDKASTGLIVRTLPNDDGKLTRSYDTAAFFSTEAMRYVVEIGVEHLLVDLPSIDRLADEGKLSNHRIFWNVEADSFKTTIATRIGSTITELIYVPNQVPDGDYLLNLQIAPFDSDAAPSRPVLLRREDF